LQYNTKSIEFSEITDVYIKLTDIETTI